MRYLILKLEILNDTKPRRVGLDAACVKPTGPGAVCGVPFPLVRLCQQRRGGQHGGRRHTATADQ